MTVVESPICTTVETVPPPLGIFLKFEGVDGNDVYNITAPFEIDGRTCIAARVEARKSELESHVLLFEKKGDVWDRILNFPNLSLQDPFVVKVDDKILLGGVETFPHPTLPYPQGLGYRTCYYSVNSLQSLELFAKGPDMMKGVRILKLKDESFLVLTRPQSPWVEGAGPGKIGYTIIASLEDLTPENIFKAKIIPGLFGDREWGGANELYLLDDGQVGVLAHRAYADFDFEGQILKHYQAMAFKINPFTGEVSSNHIIASRKDFSRGPSKFYGLEDVIYPGGLIRHANGSATLYAGLSDTQAGILTIEDPFRS